MVFCRAQSPKRAAYGNEGKENRGERLVIKQEWQEGAGSCVQKYLSGLIFSSKQTSKQGGVVATNRNLNTG